MLKSWLASFAIAVSLSAALVPGAQATDIATVLSEAHQVTAAQHLGTPDDYLTAANAGNVEAQLRLADLYLNGGEGVVPSYLRAHLWAQMAADQGSARALITLGTLYRDGLGIPKDSTRALNYFQAASDAGDTKGPRYVGLLYESSGDDAKAFAAYQLGADRGDITSQFLVGRSYELGIGVATDYTLAAQWYVKSAERGDIIASDGMVGLASLTERGLGVDEDTAKALALYQQAASVGNEPAAAAVTRLSSAV